MTETLAYYTDIISRLNPRVKRIRHIKSLLDFQTHSQDDAPYEAIIISIFDSPQFSLYTKQTFSIIKESLTKDGLICVCDIPRSDKPILEAIAQTLSVIFPVTFNFYTSDNIEMLISVCNTPEVIPTSFSPYEARSKGSLTLTHDNAPTDDRLTPEWVKQQKNKLHAQPQRLQKFTTSEATQISKMRIQQSMRKWLAPLSGHTGNNIDVYVMDTGLNETHKEFQKALSEERIIFHNGSTDSKGHGTHLSSLICGEHIGIAPDCILNVINITSATFPENGSEIIQWLEKLIHIKPKNKIGILNTSFCIEKSEILNSLLDQLVENNFICIAAAGNRNSDVSNWAPANNPNVISVGAHDNSGLKWSKGNFGNITVSALGQNIIGAHHADPEAYFWMSGTSVSCSLISGLAALYFEKFPANNIEDFRQFLKNPRL